MESTQDNNLNDNVGASRFKLIHDSFGKDFGKYQFEAKGSSHAMYFNNCINVLRVGNCLVRAVCDREDNYFEVAELSAPEAYRKQSTPNLWFDVSVLVAYLENATSFSWFYDYPDFSLDPLERAHSQFSYIAEKMRPYWPDIIDLFGTSKLQDQKDELFKYREKWAGYSWKALGWNDLLFREQKKTLGSFFGLNRGESKKVSKIVLGRFPEFFDKARETSSSFLGVDPHVWTALQKDELRWAVTKQFLDNALKAYSTITLATEARFPKSYFAREVDYLVSGSKSA
jgi:hypothetical protein